MRVLSLVFALLSAGTSAQVPAPADPTPHSDVRLVADATAIAPGDTLGVAVEIVVEDGWHVYWQNPGDSGQPVTVEWTLPAGAGAGPLRFPAPDVYEEAGIVTFAHGGTPMFVTDVVLPAGVSGAVDLAADLRYLICADVCLPASATLALTVPVGETVRTGALDAARAALPIPSAEWTASASATAGGYVLTVVPPAGVDFADATFFPSAKGVLDHGAPQAFRAEGRAYAVELTGSPYASSPSETLAGVLVAGDAAVELSVPVAGVDVAAVALTSSLTLWSALMLALLGGVVLNLMPCVFPILSIKILGFVEGRTDDRRALRLHGLAFGAGVVASFLALAAVLLALKATGDGTGWGFQLSYPWVVAALAALMVALALNLLGVFEIGQGAARVGGQLDRGDGLSGAFLSGVLATVVASPCTAPFMAGALGFAVVQPAPIALAVFGALGVGMAAPYVLLSFQPALLDRLPRPGPWMVTLRQVLAFPLLATAVWLVWVFGTLRDLDAAAVLLLALVVGALGAWAWGRWPSGSPRRALVVGRTTSLLAMGAAVALAGASLAPETETWAAYDARELESLVAEGRPVFVDVTASWCLTCQVNKQTALASDAVEEAFAAHDVARVRADWTDQNPAVTAFLDRFGRSGVPLYVLFPGDGAEPVILPEILTPGILVDALGTAPLDTASR
ncbi:protein-disulfide reductase DsbD family protein [Rubrivirga sp. IMCC43871]|uniref:protein-disulfide reductase DsbD family protein n=1 Tax=Rubrivirga sp. IMCC43871 TaxID=3391575 RepID=UPI00398FD94D